MKINEIIKALEECRDQLGGEEDLRIHLNCNGDADYVDITEITTSKVFGLRLDVTPPWWVYNKNHK